MWDWGMIFPMTVRIISAMYKEVTMGSHGNPALLAQCYGGWR